MNADLMQLLFYGGFALLGWFLRHKGILKPAPTPNVPTPDSPSPLTPLLPILSSPWLADLLKQIADAMQKQQQPAPAQHVVQAVPGQMVSSFVPSSGTANSPAK